MKAEHMEVREAMMGLAEAAALARMAYQDAHRAMLLGVLRGEKRGSRWYVRREDAERLAAQRATASGSSARVVR